MSKITAAQIAEFYDEFGKGMLKNYICGNKRIDDAINFVARNVPANANLRALDLGCAIGITTSRLTEALPKITALGVDISSNNIQIANALFATPRTCFMTSDIAALCLDEKFDLVTLFDVYEHIRRDCRRQVHQVLSGVLSKSGKLFMTVPSELNQHNMHTTETHRLQIVDEPVTLEDAQRLAADIGGALQCYNHMHVWRSYDYVHVLIDRDPQFTPISGSRRMLSRLKSFHARQFRRRRVARRLGVKKVA